MQVTEAAPLQGFKGYNNYGAWLRQKYKGQRVFKVIVDGGFTCPNRDGSKGYGGCTYCNVDSFTPSVSRNAPTVREQVMQGMERARKVIYVGGGAGIPVTRSLLIDGVRAPVWSLSPDEGEAG